MNARETHLVDTIRTIVEPDEMNGFVRGIKENSEFTTTIADAVRRKCEAEKWPAP